MRRINKPFKLRRNRYKTRVPLGIPRKKEEKIMTPLASSSNRIVMIDKDKYEQFMQDSERNVIKPEFLKKCLSYSSLFQRDDKKKR